MTVQFPDGRIIENAEFSDTVTNEECRRITYEVVLAERERCARIAESFEKCDPLAAEIAAKIRASE